jgi:hypothetical protein
MRDGVRAAFVDFDRGACVAAARERARYPTDLWG